MMKLLDLSLSGALGGSREKRTWMSSRQFVEAEEVFGSTPILLPVVVTGRQRENQQMEREADSVRKKFETAIDALAAPQ
jgi:hypothetical protein